jgi:hypothetical protein
VTRLIVTTNHREAPLQATSGWLYVIDLDTRKILRVTEGMEPPNRSFDHNPRGGMRGMRGLSFNMGELATADYSSVFFFDCHWNLLRAFSHPSVSAIHEILYVDDGVWVTSTANDLLVKFDPTGKLTKFYYLREQRELIRQLEGPQKQLLKREDIIEGSLDFRSRTYFKSDLYDRVHINGIAPSGDGRLFFSLGLIVGDSFGMLMSIKTFMRRLGIWNFFISLNRLMRRILGLEKKMLSELVVQPFQGKSAIISMDKNGQWRAHLQFPVLHNPSHSVRMLEDGTGFYLATSSGALIHFDEDGNTLSNTKLTDKFLRGLLVLPNRQLVIGAGNSLLVFDYLTRKIVTEIELSKDPLNTVFEVGILPPDFDLPPASLQAKVGRVVGFKGQEIIWEKPHA